MARGNRSPTGNPIVTLGADDIREAPRGGDTLPQAGRALAHANPDQTFEEHDEEAALAAFLSDIGEDDTGATVHVSKLEQGNKEARCWKGAPAEYDLERIAEDFGSGDYVVKVYTNSERGNPAMRIRKVIRQLLSPAKERERKRRLEADDAGAPSGGATLTESRVAEIVASALRAAMPAQTQADPFVQMERLSSIMKNMQPSTPAPSMDSLALITGVAKIFRDLTPERDPIEKGVNAGPFDLLMKYAEPIMKIVTTNAQQQAGNAPALPAPAPGAPVVPGAIAANPGTTPPTATPEDDPMFMLKMGIRFLVEQAKRDADPQLYADMVIDQVPPDDLKQLVAAPDFVAVLAQFNADVPNHRAWFEKLKAEVVEGLKPEEGAAP